MTTDNPDQPTVRDETWDERVSRRFSAIAEMAQLNPRFSEETNRLMMLQEAQFQADKEMLDEIHLMLRDMSPRMLPSLRQTNLALQRRINELVDERAKLVSVIQACEAQFRFYAEQHLAKEPPDEAKARTNAEFVELCRSAL